MKAIYCITNLLNNKKYIGQSKNPYRRLQSHKSRSKHSSNSAIHNAIRKYGMENFKFEILEWTNDYNNREKYYIKKFNTMYPNGYNLTEGGEEPPVFYGKDNLNTKLSDDELNIIIKELKRGKLTETEIIKKLKHPVRQSTIYNINHGIIHHDNRETYPLRKSSSPYHLTDSDLETIIFLLKESSFTMKEIANYFGVNQSTIKHINTGRNHHVNGVDYPLRSKS